MYTHAYNIYIYICIYIFVDVDMHKCKYMHIYIYMYTYMNIINCAYINHKISNQLGWGWGGELKY